MVKVSIVISSYNNILLCMKYIFEGSQDLCIVKLCVQFVSMFLKVTFHPLTHPPSPQNFFSPEIFQSRDLRTINDKMKLGFRNDPLPQIFLFFLTASLSFYIKQTSLTLSASDDKVKISGSSLVAGNKLINDDANDLSEKEKTMTTYAQPAVAIIFYGTCKHT